MNEWNIHDAVRLNKESQLFDLYCDVVFKKQVCLSDDFRILLSLISDSDFLLSVCLSLSVDFKY